MNNNTTSKDCFQLSLQGQPTKELFRSVFCPLLLLSIFGNLLNTVVYRHPFLRSSTTVRLLSFKAIANMLSVISMTPSFLYFYLYDDQEGLGPFQNDERPPWLYYHSLKYAMFSSNCFSTAAVWLTVVVTLEHCILVSLPVQAKIWSTMRNALLAALGIIIFSATLHILNLIAYKTVTFPCPNSPNESIYYFLPTALPNLKIALQIYFWIHSITVQILPMFLLVMLSSIIYKRLFCANKFSTNSEQRQTVVRLALATTACHIVFEMPHVVVMVLAAVFGGHQQAWPKQQEITAAAMFLGFTNASVAFLVYLACSKKFRQIALMMCCPQKCVGRWITHADRQALTARRSVSGRTVMTRAEETANDRGAQEEALPLVPIGNDEQV